MYGDIFLISLICVLVIDIAGAVEDLVTPLVKKITGAKVGAIGKPFNCSTCMTFWTGLLYLILVHGLGLLPIAYLLLIACLTPVTLTLFHLAEDLMMKAVELFYKIFNL